jgi:acrylyl-CoA reductase (NADPH)
MADAASFPCFMVRKDGEGRVSAVVERITRDDLPAGDVLIAVAYSSLNYKDALASQGHPGVVRSFPHVPGIDCAGSIVASTSPKFKPGEQVLVTGYDLGAGHWGGFSAYVRVPADWVVPMPATLTPREAMIYGTAGFTAAQCVTAIVERGACPERGEVVVTGATGGVGCLAVAILAKLGYKVVAVTGKRDHHDWLLNLGAAECVGREAVTDTSDQPLLAAKWAAAVDTVGGAPLATIVRSLAYRGCVAACGLVAGTDLPLSIYPFILRGVSLAGIDSAKCPRPQREEMWRKLAGPWRIESFEQVAHEVTLDELPRKIADILAGKIVGRTLVVPRSTKV